MNATAQLYDDAAKEITRLRAALAKAREALGKLADRTLYEFDYENDDYIFRDGTYGGTTPWDYATRERAEVDATMDAKDE